MRLFLSGVMWRVIISFRSRKYKMKKGYDLRLEMEYGMRGGYYRSVIDFFYFIFLVCFI